MNRRVHDSPLDGTWQMLRAEHDGEQAPDMVVQRTTLEFFQGSYRVCFDGEPVDQGEFEVSLSDPAKTLVLRGTSGPNSARTIRCIYQQVGDRLRVCFGLDGIPPTDFTTTGGQKRYLATYRRAVSGPHSPTTD